ncbi:MAG TPA: 50S ribosomal protein L23 [Anaerolineales bacterium]|nr:50S ribosomal protein L23 [Anaerolineales bacterium]
MITIYNVLLRPLVTEKSSYQSGKLSQYAFAVANEATRTMVKDAVETLFDVNVTRVNIINAPAKRSRRARSRRLLVRRAAYKKAIVTLAEGQSLEIFEGVQ